MNVTVNLTVAQSPLPVIVHVVQGNTEIPVDFHITDYTIPAGSTARFYLKKKSGAEVYNNCTISGNVITLDPTAQTFAEAGCQAAQLQVEIGEDFLLSFPMTFDVAPNIIDDSAIESSNEYGALESLLQEAQQAISASYSLVNGTEIPAESDLNSYVIPGNYKCTITTTPPTLDNCPTNQTFKLYVSNTVLFNGGTYRTHDLIDIKGEHYTRYTSNNGQSWSVWIKNYNEMDTIPVKNGGTGGTTQVAAANSLGVPSLINGTIIVENTKLNTVIKPGSYKCTSASTVATLKNCPTNQAFKMYVENSVLYNGGDYRTQTIIDIDGTVYTRYTHNLGTEWSSWKYLDGMTDSEYEQLYTALGLSTD